MAQSLGAVNPEAAMKVYAILHRTLSKIEPGGWWRQSSFADISCVQLGELGADSQLAPMADELTSALVAQSTDPATAAVDAAHMAPALLALAVSQGSVLGSLAAARTLSTLPDDTFQVHAPTCNQHTVPAVYECIA